MTVDIQLTEDEKKILGILAVQSDKWVSDDEVAIIMQIPVNTVGFIGQYLGRFGCLESRKGSWKSGCFEWSFRITDKGRAAI